MSKTPTGLEWLDEMPSPTDQPTDHHGHDVEDLPAVFFRHGKVDPAGRKALADSGYGSDYYGDPIGHIPKAITKP